MELTKSIAVVLLVTTVTNIAATKDTSAEGTTVSTDKENLNPLDKVLHQNEGRSEATKDGLVRVKRQFYDPYYSRGGPYYPVPIPIFLGGGFGIGPGFGGRGFGGRGFGGGFGGRGFGGGGFGGRGFGGGGFGGRGFGGGGFGGRGFGGRGFGGRGIGGRGGIGGGRGGGRG